MSVLRGAFLPRDRQAFPTREILLGVWRLNVLATTSGLLLEVNVDAGEFPIARTQTAQQHERKQDTQTH